MVTVITERTAEFIAYALFTNPIGFFGFILTIGLLATAALIWKFG